MHQHEFSDKQLADEYAKVVRRLKETTERHQRVIADWKTLLTERAEKARGFVMINKDDKREYQIRQLWPSSECEIEVIELKPTKASAHCRYEAHLYEFTVTNRKVTT